MISLIICSIKPELSLSLSKNIEATIGDSLYEILIHDNRETNWGLAKVYNHYANMAQGEILCFIHEDIKILTNNWGKTIEEFYLTHSKAGLIGFAGSTMKTKTKSCWVSRVKYVRENLIQGHKDGTSSRIRFNPHNELFSEVAVLDGLALFCPKNAWENYPFDEILFNGFHFYDLDFSLSIAQKFTNYVCHTIDLIHFSEGNFDKNWNYYSQIFHRKWSHKLPFALSEVTKDEIDDCEARVSYKLALSELTERKKARCKIYKEHCLRSSLLKFKVKLAFSLLTR